MRERKEAIEMNKKDIKKLAEHLENCHLNAQDTLKITAEFPDMT